MDRKQAYALINAVWGPGALWCWTPIEELTDEELAAAVAYSQHNSPMSLRQAAAARRRPSLARSKTRPRDDSTFPLPLVVGLAAGLLLS